VRPAFAQRGGASGIREADSGTPSDAQGRCPVRLGRCPVRLGRCPVRLGRCPVRLGRCPVRLGRCPVRLGRCPVRLGRCPVRLGRCPVRLGRCRWDRLWIVRTGWDAAGQALYCTNIRSNRANHFPPEHLPAKNPATNPHLRKPPTRNISSPGSFRWGVSLSTWITVNAPTGISPTAMFAYQRIPKLSSKKTPAIDFIPPKLAQTVVLTHTFLSKHDSTDLQDRIVRVCLGFPRNDVPGAAPHRRLCSADRPVEGTRASGPRRRTVRLRKSQASPGKHHLGCVIRPEHLRWPLIQTILSV